MSLWLKQGERVSLERHWELERLSGLKQHGAALALPDEARDFIDDSLRAEGVSISKLNEIWGTPGIDTTTAYGIRGTGVPFHGIAHLFTAVMLEPAGAGDTLGFAVDGVPDFVIERSAAYYAGAFVRGGRWQYFPIESPGRLYDSARERFCMRAGSLMALATASTADAEADVPDLLRGLSFWGVAGGHGSSAAAADVFLDRATDWVHRCVRGRSASADDRFSADEHFVSMIMKIVQQACLLIMERSVEAALSRFDLRASQTALAVAGGFALNCPANSHLMAKYGFRRLLAPPFANDAGQSVGIALSTFHSRLNGRVQFRFPGAFLGPAPTEAQLQADLEAHATDIAEIAAWDADTFVDDVMTAPVVWFDGPSEAGPRALGHRSLLASPISPRAKDDLNRVKQRQWWRPVAPIVLEDAVSEWFEDASPSPFMLRTFGIREHLRCRVPAICHLDGSARVQTLRRADDERLFEAVSAFARRTGVPMLCNTSLNDRGEPIVNSPAQGMAFAIRKSVRVGYFHGRRVLFRSAAAPVTTPPPARAITPFSQPTLERYRDVAARINPHGLDPVSLYAYLTDPALRASCDVRDATQARVVQTAVNRAFAETPSLRGTIERHLRRIWTTHRAPCQEFERHRWSDLLRTRCEDDSFARSPF